jgi:hypothetical protein
MRAGRPRGGLLMVTRNHGWYQHTRSAAHRPLVQKRQTRLDQFGAFANLPAIVAAMQPRSLGRHGARRPLAPLVGRSLLVNAACAWQPRVWLRAILRKQGDNRGQNGPD